MLSLYSWMFRLLLPPSLGLLGATLGAIWPDKQHNGWMDIAGSGALVCAMIGVALWTFSAWLTDEDGGQRHPATPSALRVNRHN